jgi:hypothetical protein
VFALVELSPMLPFGSDIAAQMPREIKAQEIQSVTLRAWICGSFRKRSLLTGGQWCAYR